MKTATRHLSTNHEWCNKNVDIKFSAHDAFLEFNLPLHTKSLNLSCHIAVIQIPTSILFTLFVTHKQRTHLLTGYVYIPVHHRGKEIENY